MTAFSIPKEIFLKIESLMYALRAHINRTHLLKWFINERFKTEGLYLYSEKASAFDCRTMHYMRLRLEGLSCS